MQSKTGERKEGATVTQRKIKRRHLKLTTNANSPFYPVLQWSGPPWTLTEQSFLTNAARGFHGSELEVL
ncbi:hypothetical protein SRHO_G00082790 [Serrasalmus rhombeus]